MIKSNRASFYFLTDDLFTKLEPGRNDEQELIGPPND